MTGFDPRPVRQNQGNVSAPVTPGAKGDSTSMPNRLDAPLTPPIAAWNQPFVAPDLSKSDIEESPAPGTARWF